MTVKFSLGRIEHTRPHLLADTAELALLYGNYDQIAEADLVSIIRQSPKGARELLPISEADVDDDGEPDRLGGAEIIKRLQSHIEECFRQLEFRVKAFGEAYPFILEHGILTARGELNEFQTLYVFLLCCARTRSFGRPAVNRLADEFEIVSGKALEKMLPQNADVHLFGPNARRAGGKFSTNLREAIPVLAEMMGLNLGRDWDRNLSPQGDGKIDLIGIFPFDNMSHGYHVILAQCAAMEDETNWERKRIEAMTSAKRGFFHPLVDPQAALFIPACYRAPDGQWVDLNDVSGVIPIDRLRIVHVFRSLDEAPAFASECLDRALQPQAAA